MLTGLNGYAYLLQYYTYTPQIVLRYIANTRWWRNEKKGHCSSTSLLLVDLAYQEFRLYGKLQLKYESTSQGPRSEIPGPPCEVGQFIARPFSSICTASTRPPTFGVCRPCGWVRCELMRVVKGQVCVQWLSAIRRLKEKGKRGKPGLWRFSAVAAADFWIGFNGLALACWLQSPFFSPLTRKKISRRRKGEVISPKPIREFIMEMNPRGSPHRQPTPRRIWIPGKDCTRISARVSQTECWKHGTGRISFSAVREVTIQ